MNGKKGELLAAVLLEGKATHMGNGHDYDVYWNAQNREVEVKTMNIKVSDIGNKTLHANLKNNWGKFYYCMIMIYVNNIFDHCYLIPASDIYNRKSKSINIPKKWDNFQYRYCLYAMTTLDGVIRLK